MWCSGGGREVAGEGNLLGNWMLMIAKRKEVTNLHYAFSDYFSRHSGC